MTPLTLAEAADAQPFTPETLAARWQCSPRHIRNMIHDGRLPGFRVGGKLLRVRARDVEEFEQCLNTDLDAIETSGQQSEEPEPDENVVRLELIVEQQSESSTV